MSDKDRDNAEDEEEIETIDAEPVEDDENAGSHEGAKRDATNNRRSHRFIVWSLVVAVLLAGGTIYAAWPFITGKLAEQVAVLLPNDWRDGERTANMERTQSALERRLAAVEQEARENSRKIEEVRAQVAEFSELLPTQKAASPADVTELRERLATIEETIDALPGGGATRDGAGIAALGQLQSRIDDMASKVEALSDADTRSEIQELRKDNAGLTRRIATLNEEREAAEQRIAALAFLDLHREVTEGQSYAASLGVVAKLSGSLPSATDDLEALRGSAEDGVRTREALRREFTGLARRIVQAAAAPGDSVVDKTLAQLSKLVTVRRTGDVSGDTPQAIAARAEAKLADGDLEGAVDAIDRLKGEARDTAAPWLRDAKARLAAEAALASLREDIAAAMAGG